MRSRREHCHFRLQSKASATSSGSPKLHLPASQSGDGHPSGHSKLVSFRLATQRSSTTSDEGDEENTSSRASHSSRLMQSSGSTMASSLERSLELAAGRNDGLSDQERHVRAVRNSILGHAHGHRRTNSVRPRTRHRGLGTGDQAPGIRHCKPGTRNWGRGTWNQAPRTRD